MKDNKKYLILICLMFNILTCLAQIDIIYPKDNQKFHNAKPITIHWNSIPISTTPTYNVQIALDSNFTNIVTDILTTNTNYIFTPTLGNVYYIRIKSNYGVWGNFITIQIINITAIPGITAWQSADSLTTVSANKLSAWSDIANNSRMVTQTSASNQPTFINNEPLLNNKPVISFNGLSNPSYLNITPTIDLSSFSLYMLRNHRGNGTLIQTFMGNSGGGGLYSDFSNQNIGYGIYIPPLNNTTPVLALNNNYSIYLTTNKNLYRNNHLDAAGTNIPNISINAIGTRLDNPGFSFYGEIAEYIYFNSVLDSTNNLDVNNYFFAKYAPPINLGQDIIAGTSFCAPITINAENRFSSYLWNQGQTTPSISVTPNGTYGLTVTDIFNRKSYDEINVYPYKRLGNKTIYICYGSSVVLDLQTPSNFSVLWNDNTTNPIKTINANGQYTVKITDNAGCFVFDTINVIVDKPQLLPTPDASDSLRICLNEKLFLTTTTSFDSIQWSTGSTDNFIPITAPGNYNVYGKTSAGCVINKSFHVRITGNAPTANFTYSPACDSSTTLFNDNSTTNGGSITNWKWTFGNGNTGTAQNPSNTYNAVGTYNVGLKVTTNQGCTDSISKVVRVNRRPKANFDNRQACERNPTLFQDLSNANAVGISSWNWDFSGLGTSNFQNPYFEFPVVNTYNVSLTVTNSNGCRDSIVKPVKINQSPVANFSFDSVCGRTPVNFRFLTVVPPSTIYPDNITWNWNFGDNTSENAIKDAVHPYATPGTYNVMLSVASKEGGCPDTIVKQVKVYDYPVVDFAVSATQCAGKDIEFTDISQTPDGTPITKWKWYFSGQGTDTMQNTSYAFQTEGNYTIQLTATNAVGCTQTKMRSIAVSSLPTPQFTFSPQNGMPPLIVNYTNQSSTSGSYIWDYGDGSLLVSGYNPPTHTYITKGNYPIKLIATNFRGCTDTLTKYILVDKAYLDGIITSIIITPIGDYYQIQATILNGSNVEIRNLGLNLQVGSGSVIRENWSGSLLPGQTTVYNFNAEIKIGDNAIPIVCASIDNINNNSTEDKTDNNTACKEVRVGSFDLLNIYPNPAYETINFGVMLPKDGTVSISFVDVLGQILYKKDFDGVRGYNNLSMSTFLLNAAVYIAEITYDGETIREKFMRKDRK